MHTYVQKYKKYSIVETNINSFLLFFCAEAIFYIKYCDNTQKTAIFVYESISIKLQYYTLL